MSEASSPDPEVSWVSNDQGDSVVSLVIDSDWRAADLVALISALEQTYDVFLAVELDRQSGVENLGSIASKLRDLAPDSALAIPSMRFASVGVVSLEGSGEIPHEVRGFLSDLETIGQRRKANKLELQLKEQELAERRAALDKQTEQDKVERAKQVQQDKLELAQLQQQVMQKDLELASEHLALTVGYFEAKYGPDWRQVPGVQEQFDQLLAAGSKLLQDFRDGRIALQSGDTEPQTGDDGF